MSFVSIEFALLFGLLLGLFLIFRVPQSRKVVLLAASCVFYAYWDWRFLGLLALVTSLDYYISHLIVKSASARRRQLLLLTSIVINLGFLFYFKYFNFFLNTLDVALAPLGWRLSALNIILPIGISFYTFETLSYVIDIYRGVAHPAKSILDYAIFITFFPRLVAGPIMRAQQFLPQLERGLNLNFGNLMAGSQLFLRGLIKKLVIADNLAIFADQVYAAPSVFSAATVWLGVLAYSIQILCDFSGYTDMALGISRVLGIQLPENFNLPYTAQSITEFWQRWHISLSTWLRDYLYIPLGGNRHGKVRTYINLMLTMLLGGLWHGASWNFVVWGGLHGAYLAVERAIGGQQPRRYAWRSVKAWCWAVVTFIIVSVTWVFFRSPSESVTAVVLNKLLLFDGSGVQWLYGPALIAVPVVFVGGLLARTVNLRWPELSMRETYAPATLLLQVLVVYFFAASNVSPFIYFQF